MCTISDILERWRTCCSHLRPGAETWGDRLLIHVRGVARVACKCCSVPFGSLARIYNKSMAQNHSKSSKNHYPTQNWDELSDLVSTCTTVLLQTSKDHCDVQVPHLASRGFTSTAGVVAWPATTPSGCGSQCGYSWFHMVSQGIDGLMWATGCHKQLPLGDGL